MTFGATSPYKSRVIPTAQATAFAVCATALAAAVAVQAQGASDARRAVSAFVSRLADTRVADLEVRQSLTIYHSDGRHPQSTGEQRVMLKMPRRQRVEQVLEGRREVRLTVGDRTWVRHPDGRVVEVPPGERDRARAALFTALPRSAEDLLAEWKSFGVRDDVTHASRVRGRPVTVIGAGPGERATPAVWLDPEYGVVRVVTRDRLPSGSALVDVVFSEHRPLLAGFHFPHRQELFADGRLLLLVVVRSAAVNVGLADALFDPGALRREP